MVPVSNQQKDVAKHTAVALGVVEPPVSRYLDANQRSEVFILRAVDRPQDGVTAFATVGLSDHPLIYKGDEFGTRAELVGACGSTFANFDNVLATLAFCVINSHWFCAPGVIFPDVMEMHKASSTMRDIYFAHPFLWDDRLRSTQIGGRTIAWLLAVPVSRSESEFAQRNGPQALEKLFESKEIDIFDLNRPSVV